MKALSLRRLNKVYAGGIVALRDVDLEVDEGEFFGLLGPNGAGKSTIIGIISSLVRKTSGHAEVFGHPVDREAWQAKSLLGLVPQEFNFNGFETVNQIVLNQAGFYGIGRRTAHRRAERYLTELGLWNRRNSISRTLSGGMKRRLMIARALIHKPRLLILDEPTAGVDIEMRRSMWSFLRRINGEGTTIIFSTHYLEEAESLCRRIAIIDRGQIIENTDIQSLLRKLTAQSFLLDIQGHLTDAPVIEDFQVVSVNDSCLEVEVRSDQSLNELFARLAERNVRVVSMKNKSNRLEELFVQMLERPPEERRELAQIEKTA